MVEEQRDENLWRIAKKRAGFRRHLYVYVIINAFLWAIWWVTGDRHIVYGHYPWPVWPMLGWGILLAFSYSYAYHGSTNDLAREEYEKLKSERKRNN